jgi:hypothetical protein
MMTPAGSEAQVVELLPSKLGALSSNPPTPTTTTKKIDTHTEDNVRAGAQPIEHLDDTTNHLLAPISETLKTAFVHYGFR